jgi:hypothetical protein
VTSDAGLPRELDERLGLEPADRATAHRTSVSNQCSVDVSAALVSRRSRDASIRYVGSSASRSASFVSSYPARRL